MDTLIVYAQKYKHHGRAVIADTLIERDGYDPSLVKAALDQVFGPFSERP